MAATGSPMWRAAESPNSAGVSPEASTFSTARSSSASNPTRLARKTLLSDRATRTSSAPATTWALVMI